MDSCAKTALASGIHRRPSRSTIPIQFLSLWIPETFPLTQSGLMTFHIWSLKRIARSSMIQISAGLRKMMWLKFGDLTAKHAMAENCIAMAQPTCQS
jgi:hypothetical protein